MTQLTDLPRNQLESLLKKYLVEHSSRRFNFLYWNICDQRDPFLNFVNLAGKDLNRVNNVELVFRLVKVKQTVDYSIIYQFMTEYVVDPTNPKAVYVIRVDFLLSYLKSIKFDLSQFILSREMFNVGYSNADDPKKKRAICIVDDDIQSLFLVNRLHQKYRKFISQNDVDNSIITDILNKVDSEESYIYSINHEGININIPLQNGLDIVAQKFVRLSSNVRFEQIFNVENMSVIVNRFICSDVAIITARVYLRLIFKKFTKKK